MVSDPADPDHIYDNLRKVNERRQGEQRDLDERENGYICLEPGKGNFFGIGKLLKGIQFIRRLFPV